jgi:chaperonin cofactor prefoldin
MSENNAEQRNADKRNSAERKALAEAIKQLGESQDRLERRMAVMENHMLMLQSSHKQLQDLFATKTVDRGSGPT